MAVGHGGHSSGTCPIVAAAPDVSFAGRLRPFDDAISAPLPTDYREFVARYNGGQPRPSWVRCRLRGGLEYLPVDSFFPLDTPAALQREVAALSALPTGGPTFPIADSGEDVFVMTVGRGTSPVYYFQSADHVPESARLGEGLFPVADSFGQLLDRLEYHPESKPWLEYIRPVAQ